MAMRFPPPPRLQAVIDRVLDEDDLGRVEKPSTDMKRLYRVYVRPQRRLIFAGVAGTVVIAILPMLFSLTWQYTTDTVLGFGRAAPAPAAAADNDNDDDVSDAPDASVHDAGDPPASGVEAEAEAETEAGADAAGDAPLPDPDVPAADAKAKDAKAAPGPRFTPEERARRSWGVLWFFLMNISIWTGRVTFEWLRYKWLNRGGLNLLYQMRKDMHEKLLRLHVGFFDRMHSGQIMSRAIDDLAVIRDWSTHQLAFFAYCFAKLFIGPTLLFYYNWRIALAVLATLPVYAWCFKVLRPQLRMINIALRRLYSRQYAHATERIGAIRVVKAFGREGPERTAFARLAHDQVRLTMRQVLLSHGLAFAAGLLTAGTTAMVAFLGAVEIAAGRMTVGSVVGIFSVIGHVFEPVNSLTGLMVQIQRFFVVQRRVFAVLDEPEQVAPGPEKLAAGLRGELAFDRVTFRYPGQARDALADVSFTVPAGRTVAVMGPSGAGKSTLFSLLLRFYDPQAGTVSVDGLDLRRTDTASLRERVVMVQQEPTVFSGTLAENIAYGHPGARPRDVMRAAGQAELHDFIMSLPLKYEAEVGEGGVSLSGGQKQRLALATALLTDPEVLLLDDTTSALDAETEQRIRTTLRKALAGRTSLMITQRIATARACDLVLVLEDGRLTQTGDHSTLVREDGFYQRVWREQEGGGPAADANPASAAPAPS